MPATPLRVPWSTMYPYVMALSILESSASLGTVVERNSYILGELSAHPLAAPLIIKFDAFQAQWFTTNTSRIMLEIGQQKARGVVAAADDALDDFVDLLDRTLLIAVKNDRTAALYTHYFGLKPPNLLKRPILGDELVTVRNWLPSIQSSPIAAVAALAPLLMQILATADAAVATLQAAEQAIKDFDGIGAKKTLIDAFNALCISAYADLAAMPHSNPNAALPSNFADRFFPHDGATGLAAITSMTELDQRIGTAEKALGALQKRKAELVQKAADKAERKQQADEATAALKQIDEDEKALKQKKKDAEKRLKDAKKGTATTSGTSGDGTSAATDAGAGTTGAADAGAATTGAGAAGAGTAGATGAGADKPAGTIG